MSSLILASPGGKGLELNKLLWQVGFWLQHISHSSPCPWHLSSKDLRGISRYEIPATPCGGSTAACREGTEVLSSGAVGVFLARGEQKLFAAISSCSKRCFWLANWGQMFTRTSGRARLGAAYGEMQHPFLSPAHNIEVPQQGEDRRRRFLSFPSHPGTAEGHCVTVPAVLPCLGGRDGVSTAPWALYQLHGLYISPTGCMSAPQALYQPHGLYISPTDFISAPQALRQRISPAWLPVTLPRRAFCPPPCHVGSCPIFLQL